MACNDVVCGTGDWSGPKPGDPDRPGTLSASPIFNGIKVSWTYPTINAHAVAHTLLYRGVTNKFVDSLQLSVVAGNSYVDPTTEAEPPVYYYWIKTVSINGTLGELLGPASAKARKRSDETLDDLNNRINESLLSRELQTKIERIELISRDISKEILDRLNNFTALGDALNQVTSATGEALTYIQDETYHRRTADSALAGSIQSLAAGVAGNTAAIVQERQVRADKDSATASDIYAMRVQVNENVAGLIEEKRVRTTADEAITTSVNGLVATVNSNKATAAAAILTEQTARANAVSSLAQTTTTLRADFNSNAASVNSTLTTLTNADTATATRLNQLNASIGSTTALVQSETNARVSADNSLSSQINSVQSNLGGQVASVRTDATVAINAINGTINSMWTVKVDANGLVGGFGIQNTGREITAGFNVDTFWVGRAGTATKPFSINNGIVYIENAVIKEGSIGTLKIESNAVTTLLTSRGSGSCSVSFLVPPGQSWTCVNLLNVGSGRTWHNPFNAYYNLTGSSGLSMPADVEARGSDGSTMFYTAPPASLNGTSVHGPGFHTVSCSVSDGGSNGSLGMCSLSVLITKK